MLTGSGGIRKLSSMSSIYPTRCINCLTLFAISGVLPLSSFLYALSSARWYDRFPHRRAFYPRVIKPISSGSYSNHGFKAQSAGICAESRHIANGTTVFLHRRAFHPRVIKLISSRSYRYHAKCLIHMNDPIRYRVFDILTVQS